MSEEVNELIEEFLSLCFEQRQISSSNDEERIREELKKSSMELSKKLYTKAAELERSGDITKGKRQCENYDTNAHAY